MDTARVTFEQLATSAYGRCVKSPTNEAVWFVDRECRRHIPNANILNRLYRDGAILVGSDFDRIPVGLPLAGNTRLVSAPLGDLLHTFFVEGNTWRLITPVALAACQFQETSEVAAVSPLNGPTIDVRPQLRPDLNGTRVKMPSNDTVYLIDGGKRRSVSASVYNNLFRSGDGILADNLVFYIEMGAPIPDDARLVQAAGRPEYYLIDGSVKRHIQDPETMRVWNFKAPTTVNSVDQIPNGAPISAPSATVEGRWSAIFQGTRSTANSSIRYLVDGDEAFAAMYREMQRAQDPDDFIYLLGWYFDENLPLLNGNADSTFLRVVQQKTVVQIRAMLWDQVGTQNTDAVNKINSLNHGAAILDNATPDFGSHHQKVLIVKHRAGIVAFCGGVDINADRVSWQSSAARFSSSSSGNGRPMHDVHCRIEGPAARSLAHVFEQRWLAHPNHASLDRSKGQLRSLWTGVGLNGLPGLTTRISTTWNKPRSNGFCAQDRSVRDTVVNAINGAERLIYIEDQYAYGGDRVAAALAERARRGVRVVILTNFPTTVSTPGVASGRIHWLYQIVGSLTETQRSNVRVYSSVRPQGGNKFGPHSYVHSKVWIMDDELAIIGSANCCDRSFTYDSEVSAAIYGTQAGDLSPFARQLRTKLWAEHLQLSEQQVSDPFVALPLWDTASQRHVERYPIPTKDATLITGWHTMYDPSGDSIPAC